MIQATVLLRLRARTANGARHPGSAALEEFPARGGICGFIRLLLHTPGPQPPHWELFALQIRDWCLYPRGMNSMNAHVGNVFATLEAVASNELGISTYQAPSRPKKYSHAWNLTILQQALDDQRQWGRSVVRADAFT